MGKVEERLEIFSERANAVQPTPITREEIVTTLAKVFRITEAESDELITCYELNDDERALVLVHDYLNRDSFMEPQA